MAKIVQRYRVHCAIKHLDAYIVTRDDGSLTVKCGLLQVCGDPCPYLKDPYSKSPFRRAPKYEPKE
jgi:hypothetical protein